MMAAKRIEGLVKRDEVTGDQACSLMNQLIEGVLAVGSRLSPINRAGIVAGFGPVEGDVFAIALHRQLLEISRKSFQVLLVGQYRDRLGAEEIVVPKSQESHEHGQVAFERN